ncbi:hypothetical protein EDB19DRAFT_1960874 [Suillus lakei]|nr:hypothetical protein EDB19DRAFT_1960874 [Suillus lakei]
MGLQSSRFPFISDESESKIALFLTLTPGLPGSQAQSCGDGEDKVLCWKVLSIGKGKRHEIVRLPSGGRSGDPGFVFCTLNKMNTGFEANAISFGAASNFIHTGTAYEWAPSKRLGVSIENQAPHDVLFALATPSDGGANPFWTFTLQPNVLRSFTSDIYVHAFRANTDIMPGSQCDLSDPELLANRITEEDGLRVSQLGPTTYWNIYQSGDRLKVEISKSLKGIKRFRHELPLDGTLREDTSGGQSANKPQVFEPNAFLPEWAVPKDNFPEEALMELPSEGVLPNDPPDDSPIPRHVSILDPDNAIRACFMPQILSISTTARNACIAGDLSTAEQLFTQEIDTDARNYTSYANRAFALARKLHWDHALQDAIKSVAIQPSLTGYISKGIALCGKGYVRDARTAFDVASIFANRDITHFLLLIKAC